MDSEEVKEPQSQFIENQYVKVFGIIKSLQGQKNVQAFKIMPIKEINEITHHILECMNASIYYLTKANNENMDVALNNPMRNTNLDGNSTSVGGLTGIYDQVIWIKIYCRSLGFNIIYFSLFRFQVLSSKLNQVKVFI